MPGETPTAELVRGIIDLDEIMKFSNRNRLELNIKNCKNVGRVS
jgi:hypothetical protein